MTMLGRAEFMIYNRLLGTRQPADLIRPFTPWCGHPGWLKTWMPWTSPGKELSNQNSRRNARTNCLFDFPGQSCLRARGGPDPGRCTHCRLGMPEPSRRVGRPAGRFRGPAGRRTPIAIGLLPPAISPGRSLHDFRAGINTISAVTLVSDYPLGQP
jgi:hypothetical protein